MRKLSFSAGMLLLGALLFVAPSKADTVTYQITGGIWDVTFTLQQGSTPSGNFGNFVQFLGSFPGTLLVPAPGSPIDYHELDLGLFGFMGVTNYFAFGSSQPKIEIYAPGLYTLNPDGSVTLNAGTWNLGDYHLFQGGTAHDFTLTATIVPGPTSTPEPASLALLGVGALALAGIRRRKSA